MSRMSPGRSYAAALVLLLAGLVLIVVAFGLPWLTLAVALGIVATRGWGRRIASILLLAVGAIAVAAGIVTLVANATGAETGALAAGILGGLLIAVASLWAAIRGQEWPAMGGRYDRTGSGARATTSRVAAWDALDRGDDPTEDSADVPTDRTTGDGRDSRSG